MKTTWKPSLFHFISPEPKSYYQIWIQPYAWFHLYFVCSFTKLGEELKDKLIDKVIAKIYLYTSCKFKLRLHLFTQWKDSI